MVDLAGAAGREQAGPRPAIVLTTAPYHELCELAVVVPVTANIGPWPWKVLLPPAEVVRGSVLCDQMRALHRPSRGFRIVGRLQPDSLARITERVADLLSLGSGQQVVTPT